MELDPTKEREIQKTRPCVIISPDVMNQNIGTVIIAPITSTVIDWPFRLKIVINDKKSSIAFDQIRSVTKERIGDKLGQLNSADKRRAVNILQEIFVD